MKNLLLTQGFFPETLLRPTIDYILQTQLKNGCIPWFKNGKADPWDHIEAAMGLTVGGEYAAAQRAYLWLAQEQLADGSWWAAYESSEQNKNHRETNFIAYVATGVWHYFLVTGDKTFLKTNFSMVARAINFVLQYQAPTGEIYWAVDEHNHPKKDALITACASIYKSLDCAIKIAEQLSEPTTDWRIAHKKLHTALGFHPEYFDRTWEPKIRFSMDWFYPILAGVYDKKSAQERLDARWKTFIEPEIGCRCVSDEPWVTVAESCELVLALMAIGDHARANQLFSWLHQFLDVEDGGYWTGYNFKNKNIWPQEKTTWTAGVVLLAADALTQHTKAANLFSIIEPMASKSSVNANNSVNASNPINTSNSANTKSSVNVSSELS